MSHPIPLTESTEDYLKAIYKLEARTGAAQTSAIAEELDIAPPSVSGMIKRLSEAAYVEHVPYKGVKLTASGRLAALRMLRRHRIIESYLIEKLGYDWDTVHIEAERLEHAVSDQLIERMAAALGNPLYDPHGAPIPSASGEIVAEEKLVPMTALAVGELAELRRVGDDDAERLRFLASLGLKPGVCFTVRSRQPFNGPVTLLIDRREVVLGNELAQTLGCLRRAG